MSPGSFRFRIVKCKILTSDRTDSLDGKSAHPTYTELYNHGEESLLRGQQELSQSRNSQFFVELEVSLPSLQDRTIKHTRKEKHLSKLRAAFKLWISLFERTYAPTYAKLLPDYTTLQPRRQPSSYSRTSNPTYERKLTTTATFPSETYHKSDSGSSLPVLK
jgi:hypothetical protein